MDCILYINNSDSRVFNKKLTPVIPHDAEAPEIPINILEDSSIVDPTFIFSSAANVLQANYMFVPELGRYYYITDIVLTGKLFECHCHIDVLETYKDQIKVLPAVIARQESQNNVMLTDGLIKTYANPEIEIRRSSGGFTDFQYIFCVAG